MFLQKLITVTPFPDETKQELLSSLDTLSVEKKFELTELCWTLITEEYEEQMRNEIDEKMLAMIQGNGEVTKEDVIAIEDRLFNDLTMKLGVVGDEAKLHEVKEELKKIRYFKNIKK